VVAATVTAAVVAGTTAVHLFEIDAAAVVTTLLFAYVRRHILLLRVYGRGDEHP
jgi:hypothetical protein